jgi:ribosome-associated protein
MAPKFMKTLPFQLRPNQEFIELHKLLKFMGVAESGGEAKQLVAEGLVTVNGVAESRKACKIRAGQVVETGDNRITVAPAPVDLP